MNVRGFTLLEIVVAIAILGILAALSITQYAAFIERARIARAIAEIRNLSMEVMLWESGAETAPDSLAAAKITGPKDPWGNEYQYLKIIGPGPGTTMGKARKDKFLVPINSSFDLYSMGKDGETTPPLNSKKGRDDIVRANDGSFIGLATRY